MEPSMPARTLLDGLEQMAAKILHAPPKPISVDDVVRVRVAADGGVTWKKGRVLAVGLDNFGHRKFTVEISTVLRVDEVSVRKA